MKKMKIILIIVCILAALLFISLPQYYNGVFQGMVASDSAVESGRADVLIHGFYLHRLFLNDRFYGTISITQNDTQKTYGGKTEMELNSIGKYDMGTLLCYSSKGEKYVSLGVIFWDAFDGKFLIQSEIHDGQYIGFPAETEEDMKNLIDSVYSPNT